MIGTNWLTGCKSNYTYDPATIKPTILCQNTPFQQKFMNIFWILMNSDFIIVSVVQIL